MTTLLSVRADELRPGDVRVPGQSRLDAVKTNCARGRVRLTWHPEGRDYLPPDHLVTVRRPAARARASP